MTVKRDLDGNPIVPLPKCIHCKRTHWDHKAVTQECPRGMKHRVMGWNMYGPTVFTPKQNKPKGE